MKSRDQLFWIWLSEALGAGSRDFKALIDLYKTPYEIFNTEQSELERVSELSDKTIERLGDKSLFQASRILEMCEKLDVGILTYFDELYPAQLKELRRPPVLLYYKGTLLDFEEHFAVGMVGTRHMSAYGLQNAYRIAYGVAFTDAVVVSGMAAGIDGVCAAAALKAGGKTVAILGCGIDRVYPKHHTPLMEGIAQNGLLLSEYPPGTPPNHYHFPTRNRLISGLSRTTVVVEAGLGSGSLITARDAISQGKTVFAVPANVGSRAASGSNGLLRDGAKVAMSARDVLFPYQYSYGKSIRFERLIKLEKEELEIDYPYLDRMGVISLVKRQDTPVSKNKTEVKHPSRREAPLRQETTEPKAKEAERLSDREQPANSKKQTPEEVLATLSATQLAVFEAMPDDRAVSLDALGNLDCPYGEIMAALTMLEIMGLIQKLPGALYTKI